MAGIMDFLTRFSFNRIGGSADEKRAAAMLRQEIAAMGGESTLLPFSIPDAAVHRCSFTADGQAIPCAPYLRSGSMEQTLRLRYLEDGSEADFADAGELSYTLVLLNRVDVEVYQRLIAHHAAAFATMQGYFWEDFEASAVYARQLRPKFTKHGKVPGIFLCAKDALALVQHPPKFVHLTLAQEDTEAESQNVLVTLPGSDRDAESIMLTAHYDSVPVGVGAYDNATGSAALLELLRYFLSHPTRRTLRFLWCGSEELGLLGSQAYVQDNPDTVARIGFCFNFDMCGTAIGYNRIVVTGVPELETYITQLCRMDGYPARTEVHVHSSDSACFNQSGIPSLSLGRVSANAAIHVPHDRLEILSEAAMEKNVAFAAGVIGRFANAVQLPVGRGMTDELQKQLDERFRDN